MYLTNKLRRTLAQLLQPCLALFFLSGTPVFAALPGSYDVEVVIFTFRRPGDGGEQWPILAAQETGSAGLYRYDEITELPVSSYRLNGISNGLRQSSAYAVVFHKAWRQPAYDSANAVGYPVAVTGNGSNRINGSIRLARERFLHLDADLLMVPAGSHNAILDTTAENTAPVYTLREKRRIKSRVVHYFDHPRFGIIATVTPYVSAAEAQQIIEEENREEEDETPVIVPLPDDNQLTR